MGNQVTFNLDSIILLAKDLMSGIKTQYIVLGEKDKKQWK